ncbi:MAG: hypothetical protein IKP35_03885 [Alphaproteobacteria bacterium]|nr:hypothetical protein [Alphaproteobacteria bacterium]
MKKCALFLALFAVLPALAANEYQYSNDANEYYTVRPNAKPRTYKNVSTNRKTGGYKNTITNNFYYNQPAARTNSYGPTQQRQARNVRYQEPEYQYSSNDRQVAMVDDSYEERTYTRKTRTTQMRKYFLAHPFFQPLKGKFGSVTDFSYAKSSFKFDILGVNRMLDADTGTPLTLVDPDTNNPISLPVTYTTPLSGKAEMTQFLVKEDFSFGLSDTLAIIGMLQYDKTKVAFSDWSDGSASDSTSSSGLNLFGIGLQSRFVDSQKWIAMASGYYQHQKDTANTFIGELKVGYKIDRTTVYGVGRAWYSNLTKGDIYGAYVESDGDWLMLAYKTDVKDIIYGEGGIGLFSVLSQDFTLNGEAVYGYYDWHNQINLRAGLGWQPGDSFALNLYGSVNVYDTADGQKKHYINYDLNPGVSGVNAIYTTGDYKIKDYSEWKIGAQVIFYF